MVDICSIWAYDDIVKTGYLGDKQAKILKIFSENPDRSFTATEVVFLVGRGVSENIRNRITELYQMGFLRKKDIVKCSTTNRLVNRWIYTGNKTIHKKEKQCILCPKCQGEGKIFI